MPATKETLQSIREWAIASFSEDFARFEAYVKVTNFTFSQFSTQAEESSSKVNGLQVGTIDSDGAAVYAWKGPDSIRFGHEIERHKVEPHVDITTPKIIFLEPFAWLCPAENEVAFARFEALVRYIRLTRSPTKVVRNRITFFKEHLPGACREVAEALVSKANKTRTPTRTPPPTPTPPTPSPLTPRILRSARLLPQRPQTPSSPALASDQHLRNVDQALSSVRAGILAQIGAAQATSRRETAALHSKIRDLELGLVAAESSKQDLSTQSTELSAKVSEMETKLLHAEQAKAVVETERTALEARVHELEVKVTSTEKANKKECNGLREKIAVAEEKMRGAQKDAEMWRAKCEELKSGVLGAVRKIE